MSLVQQAKEVWSRLPIQGRIAAVGSVAVTLALVGAIVYFSTQGEYGVLFSDLNPADAQTIVEKLKSENVPYTLSNGGTTISVPTDRVSELRLQTASTGVLSGGHVGFDLFDKTSFGATDFAQQVNYRRAVEGELAKTLEGMDEVDQARVHITPKKESVFSEKEEGAKASVMLRVRQGKELSNERTEAIVSLISSSVEGLDPSNVSVMDTRGRLLSDGRGTKSGSFGDAGAFSAQLESRRRFETETAARVVSLIEPIAGEGRVRADVGADVDFSQVEQTEEKYNPQSQVIRSQQTAQDVRTTSSSNPGRVVGARSNDPTAPPQPGPVPNSQTGNDQRTTSTTNYEIDKTIRRTIGGGGRVNRMTVSVLVDFKTVNDVHTARSADEIQKIRELVAAAVGIDENRGDSVVVQTMPFDKPQVEEAGASSWLENNRQLLPGAIKYAALVLVAILVLLFVIRPARKALRIAMAAPGEPKLLTAGGDLPDGRRIDDADLANLPPMTVADLEAMSRADVHGAAARNVENVRTRLAEQALAEPELVAGTLRGWLRE